ncbi:MAG: hypothetical protein WBQ60_09435 [Asticcacaulis sp.]
MPSQIGKLKYIFVILLGIISASVVGYSWFYSIPLKKCEGAGNWYVWQERKCYARIYLPTITGRQPGEPAKMDFHDDAKTASNARAVKAAAAPANQTPEVPAKP